MDKHSAPYLHTSEAVASAWMVPLLDPLKSEHLKHTPNNFSKNLLAPPAQTEAKSAERDPAPNSPRACARRVPRNHDVPEFSTHAKMAHKPIVETKDILAPFEADREPNRTNGSKAKV